MQTNKRSTLESTPQRLSIAASRSPEMLGTIHDDRVARSLGFDSAFVPGETVGHFAFSAILRHFGVGWFSGGWYTMRFESPVYVTSDVIAEASAGELNIDFLIRTQDGRRCVKGHGGLGNLKRVRAEWGSEVGSCEPAAVFPRLSIGAELASLTAEVRAAQLVDELLEPANDDAPFFRRATAWEHALVPPEYLMLVALNSFKTRLIEHAQDSVPEPDAGMWAEHQAVHFRPIFQGKQYVLTSRLVDKGRRTRAAFATVETEVRDVDGELTAVLRQSSKWLRKLDRS